MSLLSDGLADTSMEALYHHTNRLLQEVTSQDLVRMERAHGSEEAAAAEASAVQKLDTIHQYVVFSLSLPIP